MSVVASSNPSVIATSHTGTPYSNVPNAETWRRLFRIVTVTKQLLPTNASDRNYVMFLNPYMFVIPSSTTGLYPAIWLKLYSFWLIFGTYPFRIRVLTSDILNKVFVSQSPPSPPFKAVTLPQIIHSFNIHGSVHCSMT